MELRHYADGAKVTMSDQRCKNCKHWVQDVTHYVWNAGMPVKSSIHPYGTCMRIKMSGENEQIERDPENALDEEPAFVEDGSDYHAALRPGPEFGCVLWEAKE